MEGTTKNMTIKKLRLLEDIANGLDFKDVASRENISVYTLYDHLKDIRRILGVRTTTQAVYVATKSNLI